MLIKIVDDDQVFVKKIKDIVYDNFKDIFLDYSIECITSNFEAQYFEKGDIFFLDIDLKNNISGLNLAETIRKHNKNIYIIFTTAHLEYGLMAYKYKTFDYLVKPISVERLEVTVSRLLEDITESHCKYLKLSNNKIIIILVAVAFILVSVLAIIGVYNKV